MMSVLYSEYMKKKNIKPLIPKFMGLHINQILEICCNRKHTKDAVGVLWFLFSFSFLILGIQ